jgi:hypothetical protein
MRPGALSEKGFLGADERLAAVLSRDAKTVSELGTTCKELGKRLDVLVSATENTPHRAARVGRFEVAVVAYTGFQMCPWSPSIHAGQCTQGGGVSHASVDWHIRNTRTGQELRGPGLAVHLIRDHCFFEGSESPFRVDPRELARLLELGQSRDQTCRENIE